MTIEEMAKILTFLHADLGVHIRQEKLASWYETFKHLPYQVALEAAKYLSREKKAFGEYQKADFTEALKTLAIEQSDVGSSDEAWERRFTDSVAARAFKMALGGRRWTEITNSELFSLRKRFDECFSQMNSRLIDEKIKHGDLGFIPAGLLECEPIQHEKPETKTKLERYSVIDSEGNQRWYVRASKEARRLYAVNARKETRKEQDESEDETFIETKALPKKATA